MDKATRRSTIRFLIGTAIGAVGAGLDSVRWMHCTRPDAILWAKVSALCCALSVILGVSHFIYYRNRRNYFAEEIDHRRSLAKGSFRA